MRTVLAYKQNASFSLEAAVRKRLQGLTLRDLGLLFSCVPNSITCSAPAPSISPLEGIFSRKLVSLFAVYARKVTLVDRITKH